MVAYASYARIPMRHTRHTTHLAVARVGSLALGPSLGSLAVGEKVYVTDSVKFLRAIPLPPRHGPRATATIT